MLQATGQKIGKKTGDKAGKERSKERGKEIARQIAKRMIWLAALCLLAGTSQATEIAGVTLVRQLEAAETALLLNGAGVRNKYFLRVYVAGLYLPVASHDAQAIMNADEPQAMAVHITSSAITRARFRDTIQEGLQQSAGDDYPRYAHLLDELWENDSLEVNKGDVFHYYYIPGEGTRFLHNGALLEVIPGVDFKRVLFGIYLGENPVQASLKKALLGED